LHGSCTTLKGNCVNEIAETDNTFRKITNQHLVTYKSLLSEGVENLISIIKACCREFAFLRINTAVASVRKPEAKKKQNKIYGAQDVAENIMSGAMEKLDLALICLFATRGAIGWRSSRASEAEPRPQLCPKR